MRADDIKEVAALGRAIIKFLQSGRTGELDLTLTRRWMKDC